MSKNRFLFQMQLNRKKKQKFYFMRFKPQKYLHSLGKCYNEGRGGHDAQNEGKIPEYID